MSRDRLAKQLRPAGPPGPSQNLRYRQGTIRSFNQSTLANVVRVGNSDLANLPLIGVENTTHLDAGVVVALAVIESETGLTTYGILGRLRQPTA